nr:TetR family transcriptional regulator [Diaminobutyricimonas aerilata]
MRSASDDRTTRARIRDAAVRLFGRDGFAATSVRAIAAEAGVSPALVLHHFESKEGLRRACDGFVVEEFLGRKEELLHSDTAGAIARWFGDTERFAPLIDYLARMLTAPSESADELFDKLLGLTRSMVDEQVEAGIMREPLDRDVIALFLTLYGVAPLVMQRQLARAFDVSRLDGAALRRATLPILDLYTHGLYTDDRYLDGARDALQRTSGPRSDKGENDPNQDPDPPAGAAV